MQLTFNGLLSLFFSLLLSQLVSSQSLLPRLDNKSKKYGYVIEGSTKWQIQPQFDSAGYFSYNRAIAIQNKKFGLIDAAGKWIIKPQFIELQGDSVFLFRRNTDSIGLMNLNGKVLIEGAYDHIEFIKDNASAMLLKNDLYGYWDESGLLISPISKYGIYFDEGLAYINDGDSIGYVNRKGDKILKVKEGKLYLLNKNGILHVHENKESFYDKSGNLISNVQEVLQAGKTWLLYKKDNRYELADFSGKIFGEYDEVYPFNEYGVSIAKKSGRFGVIDTMNTLLLPFEYDYIQPFGIKFNRYTGTYAEKLNNTLLQSGNLIGLINSKGKMLYAPTYTKAYLENDILIKVENNTLSILDLSTSKDVPLEEIFVFNQGKAIYFFPEGEKDKYGLINKKGQIALEANYNSLRSLWNGLFIAETKEGVGIIDTSAAIIVPCVYKELLILNDLVSNRNPKNILFDNYVYAITKSGKVGAYSRAGAKVVDTTWNNLTVYDEDGMIFWGQDKSYHWNIIQKDGAIKKVGLDEPVIFELKKAIAKKNGKYGILASNGKTIVPFKYEELAQQEDNRILCKVKNKWGMLSNEGNVLLKPEFQYLLPSIKNTSIAFRNGWGFLKEDIVKETQDSIESIQLAKAFKFFPGILPYSKMESMEMPFTRRWAFQNVGGIDEFTLEVFVSNSKLRKEANNFILSKTAPVIVSKTELAKAIEVKKDKVVKKPSDEYIGKGIEILNSTDSTVSLNIYDDISGNGYNKVMDHFIVLTLMNGKLQEVKLKDLFSNSDYPQYLDEIIAARLREADHRIIPTSKGDMHFYNEQYFQLDYSGLVLKVNEKILDLTYDLVGPEIIISYTELENLVNKEGPLKEFYIK